MKAASPDPRLDQWSGAKRGEPMVKNITCYAYAVADQATLDEYAARPLSTTWRPPHIGDGSGIGIHIFGLCNRLTSEAVCDYAVKDGLKRVPTPELHEPMPKPSEGHYLVAIVCGRRGDNFQYHTLRICNGIISSKDGDTSLPSTLDSNKKEITDPRTARFYHMQEGPFLFEVPNGGVNLRVPARVGQLTDQIIEAHNEMRRQAEKRRISPIRPKLAMAYQQLATQLEGTDARIAGQLRDLATLHTTGKPPAGMTLKPGALRHI